MTFIMKHVNKVLKGAIRHMGANSSQKALTNIACSVTYMSAFAINFDKECGVTPE